MIKYFVNEEKGVVVARLEGFESDILARTNSFSKKFQGIFEKKYIDYYLQNFVIIWTEKNQHLIKNLKGKSSCNLAKGDIFSEYLGKEIAKERLLKKVNILRKKFYEDIWGDLYNFSNIIHPKISYEESRIQKRTQQINYLIED